MSTIAYLNVMLATDSRRLTSGLRQAGRQTRQFAQNTRKQMAQTRRSFNQVTSRVFNLRTAIATLAGSAGVGLIIRSNMQAIGSLGNLADTIQDSTENIQAMRRQAELAGIAHGTMDSALQRAARRAAQAAEGAGAASDAYQRLGLDAAEVARMAPTDAFWAQAEAIAQLTSRADQLRAANEIFGRQAEDVIRIIDDGRESFESIRAEMELTGEAISRIDAARVEAAVAALTRLRGTTNALGQQLTIQLAPYIEAVANQLFESAKEGGQFFEVLSTGGQHAITVIGVLADGVHGIRLAFKAVEVGARAFTLVVFSTMEQALTAVTMFVDGVNTGVNFAIDQLNRLPRVDIATIDPISDSAFMQGLRGMNAEIRASVGEAAGELHELAMLELPSERIKRFVADVERQAQEFEPTIRPRIAPDFGAGDDESDPFAERLERLREHLRTEEERERRSHLKRLEELEEIREKGYIQDEIHRELKEELEAQHQERMLEIQRRSWNQAQELQHQAQRAMEGGWRSSTQFVVGQLQAMTDGIAQHSRAAFEINKLATIAQIALKTPEAAANAYAWGSQFGGPAGGALAAAAAVAAQGAQLMAAKSASFEGGGAGSAPSVAGTTPAPPVTPVSEQQPESQRRRVYVEFEGDDDQQMSLRQWREQIRRIKEEDPEAELVF